MTKKFFILSFTMLLASCAIANPDLPDTYFMCEHEYDSERNFMFESPDNYVIIQPQNCGILEVDGKCPIFFQIDTITKGTVTLSENERENYKCTQRENNNEIK